MSDESFLFLVYKRFLGVVISVLVGVAILAVTSGTLTFLTILIVGLISGTVGPVAAVLIFILWTLLGFLLGVWVGAKVQERTLPHEPNG